MGTVDKISGQFTYIKTGDSLLILPQCQDGHPNLR